MATRIRCTGILEQEFSLYSFTKNPKLFLKICNGLQARPTPGVQTFPAVFLISPTFPYAPYIYIIVNCRDSFLLLELHLALCLCLDLLLCSFARAADLAVFLKIVVLYVVSLSKISTLIFSSRSVFLPNIYLSTFTTHAQICARLIQLLTPLNLLIHQSRALQE